MNDPSRKSKLPIAVGELFARQYAERVAPLQDNPFFRNRLDAFLRANHYKDAAEIAAYLRQEAGLEVNYYFDIHNSAHYKFKDFFSDTKIDLLLSAITLIWRFLYNRYPEPQLTRIAISSPVIRYPKADAWHAFVSRALREENMAYALDEKCGVHFFIDEEFERNRITALAGLASERYAAVRVAFEQSHSYLDAHPSDTKSAVRSAFEAFEILARLMVTESKNLNKWMVENKLKPLALAQAADLTERTVLGKLFDGLAISVDGLHDYRHGQGSEQPVAPSLSVAVYVVSSVAAALRLLVAVDSKGPAKK
jgi:hypothetical protein